MGLFTRTEPVVQTYKDDPQGMAIARNRGDGRHDKIAIFGGEEYAVQVQRPDGRWLRIKWDGSIEAPLSRRPPPQEI